MTQLPLPLPAADGHAPAAIRVGAQLLPVEFVRHRRARHYVLRVTARGWLRVTIPRQGTTAEAERFVRSRTAWIQRERFRQLTCPTRSQAWEDGTIVLVNGEPLVLRTRADNGRHWLELGPIVVPTVTAPAGDLRPTVERALRALARDRLPARLMALARQHGFDVAAVSIRSQRTRWGSCSPAGRISLNWRLVQAPAEVSDYVLLHELVHLKVPSHSRRFWRALERLCPDYRHARDWLRARSGDL